MRRTLVIAAQTLVALATLLLVVYAQTREPQTKAAEQVAPRAASDRWRLSPYTGAGHPRHVS
jgi:hypothetical protein